MSRYYLLFGLLFLYSIAVGAPPDGPGQTIKGSVKTSDGSPAGDVTVRLLGTRKTTLTDDEGRFELHNVAAGDYIVEASLVGYEAVTERVTVDGQRRTELRLRLNVSARQLEEVTVTSSRSKFSRSSSPDLAKMPLKDLENPQVYATVTHELIEEQQLTDFDDALRNVTGVTKLFTGGGDFATTFATRGFTVSANLRNGISAANTSDLDPANIERIEVLKGPAGTLFGSTLVSWGGLINRVTKQPYGRFGGEVSYTGGSYGLSRFMADINTPLGSDSSLRFRVNAASTYKGSFQDYGFSKSTFFAPVVLYKPSDRLTVSLEAEFFQRQGTSVANFFIFDSMFVASPRELHMNYKNSFTNNDVVFHSPTTNFFGQVSYKLSGHWTSQTAASVSRGTNAGPYQWNNFTSGTGDSLLRTVTDWNETTTITEMQQNFISDYTWGKVRNRLVAGLDYYSYYNNGAYYYIPFDTVSVVNPGTEYLNLTPAAIDARKASGLVGPYVSNDKQYIYAAYASDVFNLTDNLILNAGARIDRFDEKGSFDPTTNTTTGAYGQTSVSPKFGVVYQPLRQAIALFANYSNGFQNNSGVDFHGRAFRPSKGNQLEGGVKLDLWAHRLSGTISYYDIYAADLLRTDPEHPNFSVQDGKQRSKGLEASVIAAPVNGLNVIAGYSYNHINYEGAGTNAGAPGTSANLYASYHLVTGKARGLGFGFGGNYAAKGTPAPGYGIRTPAYTVLDASVFYDRPRFRLGVKMDNVTNEQYWIGWYDLEPQQLRNVSVNVAFKF